MLINRQRELAYLDSRYARSGAELAILYGRRRVGKTTLMYEWCQGKSYLYFFAARLPSGALLAEFSQQLAVALQQPERTFADWNEALLALADLARDQRFVVVLVEKGLLWLRGDTSRWDVHYAFFARGFGQQMATSLANEDAIHLFTAQDMVAA
jgi:AAA+ ATPase superfamily predicted ATPase